MSHFVIFLNRSTELSNLAYFKQYSYFSHSCSQCVHSFPIHVHSFPIRVLSFPIRVLSFPIRVHSCSLVFVHFHSCSLVFIRVHSCSFVFHSCSLVFHSCSTRVHSCSLVFTRVPLVFIRVPLVFHSCSLVFTRVHSCSFVFTRVHSCSDLCGVLDMILLHCYLCSTASATHENNIIMSISNFKELWALVYSSTQTFDNDYAIFFMGDHSVSVNYK